jgi:hypothetical protein
MNEDGDDGAGRELCGAGRQQPGMGTTTPRHLGVGRRRSGPAGDDGVEGRPA